MYTRRHTLLVFNKYNNIELVQIQATQYKEDTDGCTAANYHHRNYQAHRPFTIAGEEEEHQ
jgi:hypothetical protein